MKFKLAITLLISLAVVSNEFAFARGLGDVAGGGARGGGGGAARAGGGMPMGGGGGGARPGGGGAPNLGSAGGRPNFGGGGGMPNIAGGHPNLGGGVNRPSMGAGELNRPNLAGGQRPNFAGNRPNMSEFNRPNVSNPIAGRDDFGGRNRPDVGGGNQPGIGDRIPQTAQQPAFRPGAGGAGERNPFLDNNRPATRPGDGGAGERNPLLANRPDIRPGAGGAGERNPNFDNNRPGFRPGAAGGGERNPFIANLQPGGRPGLHPDHDLPGLRPDRPGLRPDDRPGLRPDGDRNPFNNRRPGNDFIHNGDNIHIGNNNFNFNNNHNYFAVGNNRWNDSWHHGYWGGGNWGSGYRPGNAAAFGMGYGTGYQNGYWNGYSNSSWYQPSYASAAAFGLGAWALGSAYYNSGYATYSNPYYGSDVGYSGYYDYSQPIQVVAQPVPVITDPQPAVVVQAAAVSQDPATVPALLEPPPQVQASLTHFGKAQDAFRSGDYVVAGTEADLAIKEHPSDAAMHEFRALVYFAVGDYPKCAGVLFAVLSAGPGWDWTTMSSLYSSTDEYTGQLRALEQYVTQKPDAPDGHFVLAYHYITGTHPDAAINQLQQVARLQPSDQLVRQLIKGLGGEIASQDPSAPAPPAGLAGDAQAPPDIDPATIIGNRTAKRPDGTTFTLNLTADNKFTWSFERGGKKQSFQGTYLVDGSVLVLQRDNNSTMPGMVRMDGNDFNFKLLGAPAEDPGLDFTT